ncbi:MAG: hypothetical protein K0S97_1872 [Chloroflexota bacterium]|nr:hypothetical protein [Chloroflexota bacterium]
MLKGRLSLGLVAGAVLLAVAIPVLAASPHPSGPPGQVGKPDKGPETAVSVTGTVRTATDADGRTTYTVTANSKTLTISAGPSWFWGDKNPLAAFVGKSVTIAGTTHGGDTEVDVETVDGKALREAGKPPWAGGPRVDGKTHPGWKDWMTDGKPGRGRDSAPGQAKKESPAP